MKKIIITTVCAACLSFASSAMATSIFYEATDVTGVGSVTYGTSLNPNDAPVFSFTATSGDVDYDFSAFSPGEYTLSVTLDGFWADFNEDTIVDFTITANDGWHSFC